MTFFGWTNAFNMFRSVQKIWLFLTKKFFMQASN